jgi:hypothetical protein
MHQTSTQTADDRRRLEEERARRNALGAYLLSEFKEFQTARKDVEDRWLMDLRQYNGIYEPDVMSRLNSDPNRSKVFIEKTRQKVDTYSARVSDLLFPANRERNWEVDSTPKPVVPDSVRDQVIKLLAKAGGQRPQPSDVDAAILQHTKKAAQGMSRLIEDQLGETNYRDIARKVIFDQGLFGDGIMKGPIVMSRRRKVTRIKDGEDDREQDAAPGNWLSRVFATASKAVAPKQQSVTIERVVTEERAPMLDRVPVWRFYPDMEAVTLEDGRGCWEHHRLNKPKMLELSRNTTFDGETIRKHLETYPTGYTDVFRYESELRDLTERRNTSASLRHKGQYDIYERTGWIDGATLQQAGFDCHSTAMMFCNVWCLPSGQVVRMRPLEDEQYNYYMLPFSKDDTCIWSKGLPSICRNAQDIINAGWRALLDNAGICVGPQFEVFVNHIDTARTDVTNIHPFKVWIRNGGDPQYPVVRAINANPQSAEVELIIKLADLEIDEATMLPKYMTGDNPRSGAAGTAAGLSMLMASVGVPLKDHVVDFDERITKPVIMAFYEYNMKYSPDNAIKGDFDVRARGASSLVAKEVRLQQLAILKNSLRPEQAQYVKWRELTEAEGAAADLGEFVYSAEEFEEFQKTEEFQRQQKMQALSMELQLADQQISVLEKQAKVRNLDAKTEAERVGTVYSATQAAGVAASNPAVAAGADQILRHVRNPQPQPPADPNAGEQAGIETPELAQ